MARYKRATPLPKLEQPHVKARVAKVEDFVARHPGEGVSSLAARMGYAFRTVLEDLVYLERVGKVQRAEGRGGAVTWVPVEAAVRP